VLFQQYFKCGKALMMSLLYCHTIL